MGDYTTSLTLARNQLTASDTLFNSLEQIARAQNAGTTQLTDLNTAVQKLESKKKSIVDQAEIYDREFLDRKEAGQGEYSLARKLGINTLQDWSLAYFFGSFTLLMSCLMLHAALYAPNKKNGVGIAFGGAIVIGIMILGVIVRFG